MLYNRHKYSPSSHDNVRNQLSFFNPFPVFSECKISRKRYVNEYLKWEHPRFLEADHTVELHLSDKQTGHEALMKASLRAKTSSPLGAFIFNLGYKPSSIEAKPTHIK